MENANNSGSEAEGVRENSVKHSLNNTKLKETYRNNM
jgi:hypothetical protein